MAVDIIMLDQEVHMAFAVMQLEIHQEPNMVFIVVHQALAPDMQDTL